jgi:hypothetical protein
MKFTRSVSVQLMAGIIVGVGAIVVACGGDDESTGSVPAPDAGGSSSSGATSSSGTASSSGSTTTDGGGTDGGGDSGAKKANGEGPCATGAECQSGECFVGKKESFCSIKCDTKGGTDPKCEALKGMFSGECNNDGYCKLK